MGTWMSWTPPSTTTPGGNEGDEPVAVFIAV